MTGTTKVENQPPTTARWILKPPAPQDYLSALEHLPLVARQLLFNRGIEPAAVTQFFKPDYAVLPDPSILDGTAEAAEHILAAIKKNERIVVHGDYDADGVTAAAILYEALVRLGARVDVFIPDRYVEGYGVALETLTKLYQAGTNLVITVDCGISSAGEIAKARKAGLKVIVTDHHLPPAVIPEAEAVVNPNLPGSSYPEKGLTGAGVAFKVAQAVLQRSNLSAKAVEQTEKWLLDLVAIGTVADMAPLIGENRVLVSYGLLVLRKTRRPGLRQLVARAGLPLSGLDAGSIGFCIAPRLNAAGRLAHAHSAFKLLVTKDEAEAERLSTELSELNSKRQEMTNAAVGQAKSSLAEAPEDIVFLEGDWIHGVIGLIAGQLAREYKRPVIVLERGPRLSRGSARSVAAMNMVDALAANKELLQSFGGHAAAAGFTVPNENIAKLRESLIAFARQAGALAARPELALDAALEHQDVTLETAEQLGQFSPFGSGNQRPQLFLPAVEVLAADIVGKDRRHAKFRFRLRDGRILPGIGFGLAARLSEIKAGARFDLAGLPVAGMFKRTKTLEWHVNDFRSAAPPPREG